MFGQEIHTLDLLSNPSLQCSESRNIHILPVVGQALLHTDPALGDIPFPIWCVQASSLRTFLLLFFLFNLPTHQTGYHGTSPDRITIWLWPTGTQLVGPTGRKNHLCKQPGWITGRLHIEHGFGKQPSYGTYVLGI